MKAFRLIVAILLWQGSVPCQAEAWQAKKHTEAFPADQSSHVYDIIQDRRGLIYFATDTGILEYDGVTWRPIELPSKVPVFSFGMNAEGRIFACAKSEVGYLLPDKDGKMGFESLVKLVPDDSKALLDTCLSVDGSKFGVVFATEHALLRFDGNAFKIFKTPGIVNMQISVQEKLFFIDSDSGLMTLNEDGVKKIEDGNFFRSQAMAVTTDNKLAVATLSRGILIMDVLAERLSFTSLPGQNVSLLSGQSISRIVPYQGEFLVAVAKQGLIRMTQKGEKIAIDPETLENIGQDIYAMYLDEDEGSLWLASELGISMLDVGGIKKAGSKEKGGREAEKFSALVRSLVSTKDESVIFGGTYFKNLGGVQSIQASELNHPELPFDSNALRFNFASNNVSQSDEIEYQTYLEGFDKEWTEWSKRRFREFTNLYWDDYVFKVRAKKADGTISEETRLSFTIEPPWYERVWFYAIQIAILFTLMMIVVVLQVKEKKLTLQNTLNGIVVSTVFGYIFSKVGAEGAIAALSGGAAFLSVFLGSAMGIFLNPLQDQFGKLVVKTESVMAKIARRRNLIKHSSPEEKMTPLREVSSSDDDVSEPPKKAA